LMTFTEYVVPIVGPDKTSCGGVRAHAAKIISTMQCARVRGGDKVGGRESGVGSRESGVGSRESG